MHTNAIRESLLKLAPFDPLRREPDLFYVCLFDVALGTGLRLGELRALRWRDVDRERRLIRVERAYSRQELRRPKTESGVRSVPLFPTVDAAFRELAARAVERGRYAPDELVFGSMHGTRSNRRTSDSGYGTRRCGVPSSRTRATASTISGTRASRAWSPPAPTSSSFKPSPGMRILSSRSALLASTRRSRDRGGRTLRPRTDRLIRSRQLLRSPAYVHVLPVVATSAALLVSERIQAVTSTSASSRLHQTSLT